MKLVDAREAASQNLFRTYLDLGGASPGSMQWTEPGFIACTGAFEHPICNFAADLHLTRESACRIRDLASTHSSFSVYSLDSEEHNRDGDLLIREGFRLSYQLVQMVCDRPRCSFTGSFEEVTTPEDRSKAAAFMVEQFFRRQPLAFRKRVAEATARATGLRLYQRRIEGIIGAGMMICESEGMIGIYNLCVAPQFRNRGIGRELVSSALRMAEQAGSKATLQCDFPLVSWYAKQGFSMLGTVDVYNLPQYRVVDIMG